MNYLVTGCAGYLGSLLCYKLVDEGNFVIGVDKLIHGGRSIIPLLYHDRFRFIKADISETDMYMSGLNEETTIVHLAAIVGDPAARRMPEETRSTNIVGSRTLFRVARDRRVAKLVFVSTCSNYGIVPAGEFAVEDTVLQPLSLYALSKVQLEQELVGGALDGMNWTILRLATLYGLSPRPRFDLTVNEFTMRAITQGALEVYLPESSRPYLHVADAANAITLVADSASDTDGQVFNVGNTTENYRKMEVVELIRQCVGNFAIKRVDGGDDRRDYRVSFGRIAKVGFSPRRTVRDGIAEIANSIRGGLLQDVANREFVN